jgi:hypothetical protein
MVSVEQQEVVVEFLVFLTAVERLTVDERSLCLGPFDAVEYGLQ